MAEPTRYPVRIAVQIQPQNCRYSDIRPATSQVEMFTLVAPGPVFDPTPVRDWLDFRDDINRSRIAMTGAGHV